MAVDIGGKKVRVVKGDNLWNIAKTYTGSGSNYQKLATLNGISNPNLIYVGQIISYDLSGTASSSGGSSTSTNSNCVTIKQFGLLSSVDNTIFATWEWGKESTTASYQLEWKYKYSDGVELLATDSKPVDEHNPAASRQVTYNIPSGAVRVELRIKPIAKEKESSSSSSKKTYEWEANWTVASSTSPQCIWTDATPVETPSKPSVEIKKYKLTAELTGLDDFKATHIVFEIYKNNGTTISVCDTSPKQAITATKTVSYTYNVEAGCEYQVRCKAYDGTSESEWSAFSDAKNTSPAAPDGIISISATSKTSVSLEWSPSNAAESYDIEYTTKKDYFDYSDQTQKKTDIEFTRYEITDLQTGEEWFFRVRAKNSGGDSPWCEPKSITIGKKPSPPTTWSSTTTVIVGEPLTLFWVHNTVDGSSQKYAELELIIDGIPLETAITIKNTTDEDKKDKISQCIIDTTTGVISWTEDDGTHSVSTGYNFIEGVKIQWRVRTSGITNEYSDWSVQRTIDLYAPPTLDLSIRKVKATTNQNGEIVYQMGDPISTLESFPFYVYAIPGPNTQSPVGYHLSIKANESYTSVDQIGNEQTINKDQEIYSKFFDIKSELLVEFTPGNIDLETGVTYTVTCTSTMNSGLTSTASKPLTVSWTDERYTPNAEISYDMEKYVTHIRPYCEDHKYTWYKVLNTSKTYTVTDDVIDDTVLEDVYTTAGETVKIGLNASGDLVYYCIVYTDSRGNSIDPTYHRVNKSSNNIYTKSNTNISSSSISTVHSRTGEEVYLGVIGTGEPFFYSVVDEPYLVEGVTLSVYRREFDGEFTEIMTGIDNTKQTFTTDPHPALDYARYRIVAIVNSTGAVSYYDMPGFPINEVGAIIQWDEVWTTFDTEIDKELAQPPWTGSLLRIPYNIDISDNNSPDVSMINYAGRKRPVSYYGTHLGEKSSWSMDIPKDDKDTLYAIRRLQLWMGDVYVREPSGTGYWANITVSYNQNHGDVTIPVSFNITRVEGGV